MKKAPRAVVPPPVVEEQPGQGKGTGLPLVSVLPDQATMDTAKEMLIEANELRRRIDADSERLDEIKVSLVGIVDAFGLKGLRWGQLGLEYHGMKTKRTLDKQLLLENGVDAKTIADSYTESKPFPSSRFVAIAG